MQNAGSKEQGHITNKDLTPKSSLKRVYALLRRVYNHCTRGTKILKGPHKPEKVFHSGKENRHVKKNITEGRHPEGAPRTKTGGGKLTPCLLHKSRSNLKIN